MRKKDIEILQAELRTTAMSLDAKIETLKKKHQEEIDNHKIYHFNEKVILNKRINQINGRIKRLEDNQNG